MTFAKQVCMALGASIGIGFSGMVKLAAPGQNDDPDPAKTIAVYLMAAPEGTHQPILEGLSLNAPDYQFVTVRSKRKLFNYSGFIVAEGELEQFYYELEGPGGKGAGRRVRPVPVAFFLSLTAFTDWPSTWDPIQTVSVALDVPEKNRYRIFDEDSVDRLGINALTAIAREGGANMRGLADQIKTGIAKLPAFNRADQK